MHRFKRILVVCGESLDQGPMLDRVRWLAEANGAQVTLLAVSESRPGDLGQLLSRLSGGSVPDAVDDSVAAVHRARLDELAAPLRAAGLSVDTALRHGTAFIEVIGMVLHDGFDLVVKAAEGGAAQARLRGLDMHLVRKCPCPVWILKPDSTPKTSRILAAVDPDPEDPVRDGLNRLVLQLATSLADRDDAEVHVLNVWRLQEEAALRHSLVKIRTDEVERIVAAEERQSAWRLDQLMKDFRAFDARITLRHEKGVAADVIPAYAEAAGIDTIVMGTIARTGVAGFFIGNTAETILGHVTCSVLTVKPAGFVSPVRPEGRPSGQEPA